MSDSNCARRVCSQIRKAKFLDIQDLCSKNKGIAWVGIAIDFARNVDSQRKW